MLPDLPNVKENAALQYAVFVSVCLYVHTN